MEGVLTLDPDDEPLEGVLVRPTPDWLKGTGLFGLISKDWAGDSNNPCSASKESFRPSEAVDARDEVLVLRMPAWPSGNTSVEFTPETFCTNYHSP